MSIVSIVLILAGISFHAPTDENWYQHYDQAVREAAVSQKDILLVFSGSDWCKPCIRLSREVFETSYFQQEAPAHFVLLRADFPRLKKNRLSEDLLQHHEQLAEKYNPKGEFPLVLVINPEGKVLLRAGYLPGGAESYLEHLLEYRTPDPGPGQAVE